MPCALGPGLGAGPPSAQTMPRRAPDHIAELQARPRWALPWRLSGDPNLLDSGPALEHAVAEFFQGSA